MCFSMLAAVLVLTSNHTEAATTGGHPWFGSRMEVIGDADGDGRTDLAVAGSTTGVAYVVSGARERVIRRFERAIDPVGFLEIRRVGDVDRDGFADVALRGRQEHAISLLSPRTGEPIAEIEGMTLLRAPVNGAPDEPRFFVFSERGLELRALRVREPVWTVRWLVVGAPISLELVPDQDGDGVDDVACVSGGALQVCSGRTGAVLRRIDAVDDHRWPARAIAVDDLDGDGAADMLVSFPDRRFMGNEGFLRVVTRNDPEHLVLSPAGLRAEGETFGEDLAALGDVDRDGVGDFAVTSSGGLGDDVVIVSGKTRTCLHRFVPDSEPDCPRTYVVRSVEDMDGDGVRELVVAITPRPCAGSCDGVVEVRSPRTGALLRRFDEQVLLDWITRDKGRWSRSDRSSVTRAPLRDRSRILLAVSAVFLRAPRPEASMKSFALSWIVSVSPLAAFAHPQIVAPNATPRATSSAVVGCSPSCTPTATCGGTLRSVCFDASFPSGSPSPSCPAGFATPDWDSTVTPPNPLVPPIFLPRFDPSAFAGCVQLVQAELSFELETEASVTLTNNSTLSTCNVTISVGTDAFVSQPALLPGPATFQWMQTGFFILPPTGTTSFHAGPVVVPYPDTAAGQAPLCYTSTSLLANEFTVLPGTSTIRFEHGAIANALYSGCPLEVIALDCAKLRARVVYTYCDSSAPGAPFCTGDGLDPALTTSCPCGNVGAPGHGCASSVNALGGELASSGCLDAAAGTESVVLHASGLSGSGGTVFVKGDMSASAGIPYSDGIRCADGTLVRLGTNPTIGGASSYPQAGQASLSVRGGTPPGSGTIAYYQAIYRNAAVAFCPPGTANLTNGWRIAW